MTFSSLPGPIRALFTRICFLFLLIVGDCGDLVGGAPRLRKINRVVTLRIVEIGLVFSGVRPYGLHIFLSLAII